MARRQDAFWPGVIGPLELARLQQIFDDACRFADVRPDSAEAEDLATVLMAAYRTGIRGKEILFCTLTKRRRSLSEARTQYPSRSMILVP
jgi:hypothetical protein